MSDWIWTARQARVLGKVYVYAFSRRFYPERLTNEEMTLQLTSKLAMSYVEGNHQSGSVRGNSVERVQVWREVQGRRCSLKIDRVLVALGGSFHHRGTTHEKSLDCLKRGVGTARRQSFVSAPQCVFTPSHFLPRPPVGGLQGPDWHFGSALKLSKNQTVCFSTGQTQLSVNVPAALLCSFCRGPRCRETLSGSTWWD